MMKKLQSEKYQRRIGVDLGASTSVLYYADFVDGKLSMGNYLSFDGMRYVPTLIYGDPQADEKISFGWEAQMDANLDIGKLHADFKMALSDAMQETEAKEYVRLFYRYLYQYYQKHALYDSENTPDRDNTCTFVTYPVKFSAALADFLREAAEDGGAGFPNVTMISESEAAMWYAAHTQTQETRCVLDAFSKNVLTVLGIDMGAGTTDIEIFSFDRQEGHIRNVLGRSKNPEFSFAGREIDAGLAGYYQELIGPDLCICLSGESRNAEFGKRILMRIVKTFKESTVSERLNTNRTVTAVPGDLAGPLYVLNPDDCGKIFQKAAFDREKFQTMFADYLSQFPKLLKNALQDAEIHEEEIDLVVLTGGHSQWYFVQDMLCDVLSLNVLHADGKELWPVIRFKGEEAIAVARGAAIYEQIRREPEPLGEADRLRPDAQQEDAVAQTELGKCYYYGTGEKKDYMEAAYWFKKAAKQHNAEACYLFGECYLYGRGVEQNYHKASRWFARSADHGYEKACHAWLILEREQNIYGSFDVKIQPIHHVRGFPLKPCDCYRDFEKDKPYIEEIPAYSECNILIGAGINLIDEYVRDIGWGDILLITIRKGKRLTEIIQGNFYALKCLSDGIERKMATALGLWYEMDHIRGFFEKI